MILQREKLIELIEFKNNYKLKKKFHNYLRSENLKFEPFTEFREEYSLQQGGAIVDLVQSITKMILLHINYTFLNNSVNSLTLKYLANH